MNYDSGNDPHKLERARFVAGILETECYARCDADFLANPEAFSALFALAIETYEVNTVTLSSLLGINPSMLERWTEPEYAPSLSLRIRASYSIALLVATELVLDSPPPLILVPPEQRF